MKASNSQRKFAVSTGIGFDAAICEEALRSNIKKVLNIFGLGKLTYIIIALKQLLSCPFMEGEVTIDDTITTSYQKILLITSMIHKYEGGGMQIAPAANPFDGKLSVCLVHGLSKIRVLFVLPALLFGKHVKFKGVKTFDCNTLEINIHKPAIVHVDGECPGSFQQLKVSCTPKQLRIIL
jgi:diacylglycerol kinase family enzyme